MPVLSEKIVCHQLELRLGDIQQLSTFWQLQLRQSAQLVPTQRGLENPRLVDHPKIERAYSP